MNIRNLRNTSKNGQWDNTQILFRLCTERPPTGRRSTTLSSPRRSRCFSDSRSGGNGSWN